MRASLGHWRSRVQNLGAPITPRSSGFLLGPCFCHPQDYFDGPSRRTQPTTSSPVFELLALHDVRCVYELRERDREMVTPPKREVVSESSGAPIRLQVPGRRWALSKPPPDDVSPVYSRAVICVRRGPSFCTTTLPSGPSTTSRPPMIRLVRTLSGNGDASAGSTRAPRCVRHFWPHRADHVVARSVAIATPPPW